MPETKPYRRLCRRQRFQVPIGVSFRQQHLQRAMNTLRRMKVKVAARKMETKQMKKSHKKAKVELREIEAKYTQVIAERWHALEESACTHVCSDTMVALLFAVAVGDFTLADQLQTSLRELMMI